MVAFCAREELADEMGHDGVTAFVVGEDPLLLLGDDTTLLQPGHDAVHRGVEVGLSDVLRVRPAGEDRRLVAEVREVGSGQSRRLARDHAEVDVGSERLAAGVNAEDRLAPGHVRGRDEHLPVEATRAEQRGVEILEAVRRGHDDDLVARVEAVELDEELVQRLVVLAVEAAAEAGGADGVELVDEDDRGRVLARLLEELSDPRSTEAGEHLDEGRGALRVEVRARRARDGLREQRLARARRPVQEDSARHTCAEALEALAVAEELDDLLAAPPWPRRARPRPTRTPPPATRARPAPAWHAA